METINVTTKNVCVKKEFMVGNMVNVGPSVKEAFEKNTIDVYEMLRATTHLLWIQMFNIVILKEQT